MRRRNAATCINAEIRAAVPQCLLPERAGDAVVSSRDHGVWESKDGGDSKVSSAQGLRPEDGIAKISPIRAQAHDDHTQGYDP
jgi:hypothetical protein